MSERYEFPDDPEVFARVIQHFRNTSVAYWDARIDRYAREAHTASPAFEQAPVMSVVTGEPEIRATATRVRQTKRASGATKK